MESNTRSREVVSRLDGLGGEALLALAGEAVRRAASEPLGDGESVSDGALVGSVEGWHRLGGAVHAEVLRRVAAVEQRQAFRGRARTSVNLWVQRLGLPRGEAKALVERAAVLERLPQTAARLADGRLGAGHVTEAVRTVVRLDRLAKEVDEAGGDGRGERSVLVTSAVVALDGLVAGEVDRQRAPHGERTLAQQSLRQQLSEFEWREAPALLAEREQRLRAGRSLRLRRDSRDPDQQPLLSAGLAPTTYSKACNVIHSLARQHAADDPRTFEQRCHDAFDQVMDMALASGQLPDLGGEQPRVLLVAHAAALHGEPDAPAPVLDGYGPVSVATARQLCCDAEVTLVAMRGGAKVLNVGRDRRRPNRAQRRGVFTRDRGCIGCGAALVFCEIHHVKFWRDGGRTDIDNLVAVCWDCHARIHHDNWKVVRPQEPAQARTTAQVATR